VWRGEAARTFVFLAVSRRFHVHAGLRMLDRLRGLGSPINVAGCSRKEAVVPRKPTGSPPASSSPHICCRCPPASSSPTHLQRRHGNMVLGPYRHLQPYQSPLVQLAYRHAVEVGVARSPWACGNVAHLRRSVWEGVRVGVGGWGSGTVKRLGGGGVGGGGGGLRASWSAMRRPLAADRSQSGHRHTNNPRAWGLPQQCSSTYCCGTAGAPWPLWGPAGGTLPLQGSPHGPATKNLCSTQSAHAVR
jgi:hypothetical protein